MTLRDKHIITLRQQGLTCAAIGARVGLSHSRVADILRKHSPALSGVGMASARADAVVRLRRGRKTLAEIATTLGLSVAAVSTIIAKHSPSLSGRRRGYEPVAGDIDRMHRNLQMLLLRRQRVTYRALGQQFGLTASAAQQIVASLERLFTGPQAMRALQSKNALRNLRIIHLRRRRLTYPEIGARVGLSKSAVNYVIASIAPSLTERAQRRRDLDDFRRSADDMSNRRVLKIRAAMISPPAEARLVRDQSRAQPRATAMTAVSIDLIEPDSFERNHPQATAAEDDQLRQSIKAFGVLAPMVVSATSDGRYVIIDGVRRYHVARALGLRSIACVVNPETDAGTRAHIRFQLENTFKPLTDAEREPLERRLQALGA